MTQSRGPKLSPAGLVKRLLLTALFALTTTFTLLRGLEWFVNWKILAGTGYLGAVALGLACLLVASVSVLVVVYQELHQSAVSVPDASTEPGDGALTDSLLADLNEAYRSGRWNEVIKIGSVLSRPLWLTGKYKIRIEVGRLVEAAASYTHNYAQQATALIDDLGWTKYKMGEVNEAKRNINHGIDIAFDNNLFYISSKGHRHLAGIALDKRDYEDFLAHKSLAEDHAARVDNPTQQKELLAGLTLAAAQFEIARQHWDDALRELETARGLFSELGDDDRVARIYQYKGDALLAQGQLNLAKDVYRQGIAAARQVARKDGILENTIGLAKVATREGKAPEARSHYLEAAKVARELGLEGEARELETSAATLARSAGRPLTTG